PGFGFCDHCIDDEAIAQSFSQGSLESTLQVYIGGAGRRLDQDKVFVRTGNGVGGAGHKLKGKSNAARWNKLEADQLIGARGATAIQELDRRRKVAERRESCHALAELRVELEDSGCNNAERAFRSDEKLLEVIAGIVFPETLEVAQN